jgi:hypothetical protein
MQTPEVAMPPVLLAAGLDWLEGLLPVLFVLFWLVSQVWAVFRRVAGPPQQPAGPPAPRLPRPPRPLGDDVAAPGGQGDALARETLERQIEAFLRETTARLPRPPDDVGERGERRTRPKPRQTTTGARGPRPAERVPSVATGTAPATRTTTANDAAGDLRQRHVVTTAGGSDVSKHVTEAFATDLKHRIAPVDAPLQPPVVADRAVDLVSMLREPATLRTLVVLREVLDRPVERW